MFINKLKTTIKNYEYGYLSFLAGTLLLASAPFLSSLFYLVSLFIIFKEKKTLKIDYKLDSFLIIASVIIFLKSIYFSLLYLFNETIIKTCHPSLIPGSQFLSDEFCWDPLLNWAGIANLIPLFIFFLGSRNYLVSEEKRDITSKFLIAGTIPVIISCIAQYWFNLYGPFEIMYGLIKWFLPFRDNNTGAVSGLFSNPNYTGAWLSMIFPLSLSVLNKKINSNESLKLSIAFLQVSFFSVFIVLTESRGALLGLLISLFIFFGNNLKKLFIFLISFLGFICLMYLANKLLNTDNVFINSIEIIKSNIFNHNYPRIGIWNDSINFIFKKPIFGWGASSFPILNLIKNGSWYGHSHNLYLDLAISYGLIVSLCLFIFTVKLILNSYKLIYIKKKAKSNTDKAWWLSAFIFFIAQSYDVFFFDIRINLLSWIFLSGLYSIIYERNLSK